MTRGNQREKAREKNLKDSAASVSRVRPIAVSQILQTSTFPERNRKTVDSSHWRRYCHRRRRTHNLALSSHEPKSNKLLSCEKSKQKVGYTQFLIQEFFRRMVDQILILHLHSWSESRRRREFKEEVRHMLDIYALRAAPQNFLILCQWHAIDGARVLQQHKCLAEASDLEYYQPWELTRLAGWTNII